ncbi:calcium-binding_allergen Ole e 8-like [Hexamita inflata]|uniref:Calcium-binding_allergen Ole e 8-like n=1 Tax=Hexamita inflata TaxID=28002 RepID=A0ABP1IKQ5_9EUKA
MPQYKQWELENMFAQADINHDEKLFTSEILLFLKKYRTDLNVEEIKKILAEFDTSKDGHFQLDEFILFMNKAFP